MRCIQILTKFYELETIQCAPAVVCFYVYFYSHQQYLTPIKLYRKFQQLLSDTLIEIHTEQLLGKHTVQCHSTVILWEHVESSSNSETLQLPKPNP